MIRTNLIPHREAFRQQQVLEYIIVVIVSVFLAISAVVVVDVSVTEDLELLQQERVSLESKNRALSKKIGELRNLDSLRTDVEGKLQIVDELQAGRFRSLETLNEIVSRMPQNIWLTRLTDDSGSLLLDGFGESSQAIANFLRALDKASQFSDINLLVDESDTVEGVDVRSFSLSLHRLTLAEQEAVANERKAEALQ